jgi:trehalose utilization protein
LKDPKQRETAKIEEKPAPGGLPKATDPLTPSVKERNADGGVILALTLPNCAFPTYREDGAPSHVKVLHPEHPLAKGLPSSFDIPHTEMYSSPFHVPKPDVSIIEETWDKGESFTSGSYWKLGKGGVIYFRPGHESYPVFKQAETLKFIDNAVRFLAEQEQR